MAATSGSSSNGFLDRGTIGAVIVIAAMWWGWSVWFEKNYSSAPVAPAAEVTVEESAKAKLDAGSKPVSPLASGAQKSVEAGQAEVLATIETDAIVGDVSSDGFSFKNINIKNFKNRDESDIQLGTDSEAGLLGLTVLVEQERLRVPFQIEKTADRWIGSSQIGGLVIQRTLEIVPTEGEVAEKRQSGQVLKISTTATGDLSLFRGFEFSLVDKVKPPETGSLFAPSYDFFDWFVKSTEKDHRFVIDREKLTASDISNVLSVALSSHYFTFAVADQSPVRPNVSLAAPAPQDSVLIARGSLVYPVQSKVDRFQVDHTVYIGAKDVDLLRGADKNLETVVDYGFFAALAEPLLWLMRFFYGVFGNWGLAIIGLTLVVRILVLPLNVSSFKSMKAMQRIQPQMQAVREKYKSDPRRMNEEVMRLMKENKANPLGGCLPMLLQLPVFFALYQVLGQSVELYRQPFMFWIQDLTVKDPYYVLPVLMGLAMFGHQKLTPVADPQQAKIMMWIPVIMPLFMLALPSGLTLYILLSTAFGVGQQMFLMRDKDKTIEATAAKVAKA